MASLAYNQFSDLNTACGYAYLHDRLARVAAQRTAEAQRMQRPYYWALMQGSKSNAPHERHAKAPAVDEHDGIYVGPLPRPGVGVIHRPATRHAQSTASLSPSTTQTRSLSASTAATSISASSPQSAKKADLDADAEVGSDKIVPFADLVAFVDALVADDE